MTSPTKPEGELVVFVGGEQVHLRPAPHLKQALSYQPTEVPLCRVRAILRQVICQLVDAWLVDRPELERSGHRPLVQSADLIVECLVEYSYLFVDVAVLSDSINTV